MESTRSTPCPTVEAPLARTASLPLIHRILCAGSLIDSPHLPRGPWDPTVLKNLARADRIGEISWYRVEIFDDLEAIALEGVSSLFAPNSAWGTALGHRIRDAVERRRGLWLARVSPEILPELERVFGPGILHVAGRPDIKGAMPVALNPLELVRAWADDPTRSAYLRRALAGVDSLRAPQAMLHALRRAGVQIRERSILARLAVNPRFLAYLIVFIYSSLRALPVAFVPGFHGRVWVLWSIDVLTAIPYTWGVLAMVAGRRLVERLLGLVVTIVTFVSPYIYFWFHGKDYPIGVIVFVVGMILGAVGLEVTRWLRDRVISRELLAP